MSKKIIFLKLFIQLCTQIIHLEFIFKTKLFSLTTNMNYSFKKYSVFEESHCMTFYNLN